jgi:hypothetical protein
MTATKKTQSRTDRVAADQAMIDGTTTNQAKLPATFPLGNKAITPPELIQVYQQRITSAKAVVAADAARAAAVKADQDLRTQTRPTTNAYKRLVLAMFAEAPDVLATFGLKAPTPTPPTAATKAAAAAKAKATRKVVGTLGTQQKKAAKAAAATAPAEAPVAAPPAANAGTAKSPR